MADRSQLNGGNGTKGTDTKGRKREQSHSNHDKEKFIINENRKSEVNIFSIGYVTDGARLKLFLLFEHYLRQLTNIVSRSTNKRMSKKLCKKYCIMQQR